MKPQHVELHGQPLCYYRVGEGSPVVLIHGITSSSKTWRSVIPLLAEHHEVIAPDLLGHGHSGKPRGDYSLGAYASGVRDLLSMLDIGRVTLVGHSLGGGVALQFAYQFPERLGRLVLVDSGGLGNEVSLALRAATLPGSEFVIPVLFSQPVLKTGRVVRKALGKVGVGGSANVTGVAEGLASLGDPEKRRAFIHTARSVIDPKGQRVDARDRLYLTGDVPTMLVWGGEDPLIPIAHGRDAHERMPHSRFEVIPGAGHFSHNDDPERFATLLMEFIASTEPAELTEERVRRLLRPKEGFQDDE